MTEIKTKDFQNIIEKLSPKSQIYILNMANMAQVAEEAAREQTTPEPKKSA